MATPGTVREWHAEHGWGVVDSEDTPGGCWAHVSMLALAEPRDLTPGERVELEWERVDQDGYGYRAVRVWRRSQEPVERPAARGPSGAYRSWLTITSPDASPPTA